MANQFKVEISENLEQLQELLNQQTSASGKERVILLFGAIPSGDAPQLVRSTPPPNPIGYGWSTELVFDRKTR